MIQLRDILSEDAEEPFYKEIANNVKKYKN